MSSDEEVEVITELGAEALELVPSTQHLVFRIRGIPPGTALGTCNVMFRGDDDVVEKYVGAAYLCVVRGDAMYVASVARQDPDVDDTRVLLFPDWKNRVPLPVTDLALVIVTKETLDPTFIKFGADVVPCNPALKNWWRCTLKKTGSKFTFNGASLHGIEGALDILTGKVSDVSFGERLERIERKETWQSVCLGVKTHAIANRVPWQGVDLAH